jgi:hypothetical protein
MDREAIEAVIRAVTFSCREEIEAALEAPPAISEECQAEVNTALRRYIEEPAAAPSDPRQPVFHQNPAAPPTSAGASARAAARHVPRLFGLHPVDLSVAIMVVTAVVLLCRCAHAARR